MHDAIYREVERMDRSDLRQEWLPQGFPIVKIWGPGLYVLEHVVLFALKIVSTTTFALDDGSHVNVARRHHASFGTDSSCCFAASLLLIIFSMFL
jgi:hypothetical protein